MLRVGLQVNTDRMPSIIMTANHTLVSVEKMEQPAAAAAASEGPITKLPPEKRRKSARLLNYALIVPADVRPEAFMIIYDGNVGGRANVRSSSGELIALRKAALPSQC